MALGTSGSHSLVMASICTYLQVSLLFLYIINMVTLFTCLHCFVVAVDNNKVTRNII